MKYIFFMLFVLTCRFSLAQSPICVQLVSNGNYSLGCSQPCTTLSVSATQNINGTNAYGVTSIPYAPYPFNAGLPAPANDGADSVAMYDDIFGDIMTLPFSFSFYGNSYSQIVIGSNGNLSFNINVANTDDPWLIASPIPPPDSFFVIDSYSNKAFENCILAPWRDFDPALGGQVLYAIYGSAPCRAFVVSWNRNVFYNLSECPGDTGTSQVILYEGTNIIDIYINFLPVCAAWDSGRAITGLCDSNGTVAITAPGENASKFTATNIGWRFTPAAPPGNWVYTWQDSVSVLATGDTFTVCPSRNSTTAYFISAYNDIDSSELYYDTITVTTNSPVPPIVPITGRDTVCTGAMTTLTAFTDPGSSGSWASANNNIAMVSDGVVTGIRAGKTKITFADSSSCGKKDTAVNLVVLLTPPLKAIVGNSTFILGDELTLSDSTVGGVWETGNAAIATVSSLGIVTGHSQGSAIISYGLSGSCGIEDSTFTITVARLGEIMVKVYPNPATIVIFIDAPIPVNAKLTTIDGRFVDYQEGVTSLDISTIANATYVLQVYDTHNSLMLTTKVVKCD